MQPLYALAQEMEKRPDVRCVRFTLGFFLADIEEMGIAVMAITNGDRALADELANAIRENIPNLKRVYPTLDEALDIAVELPGFASLVPQRLSYKKWKGTV